MCTIIARRFPKIGWVGAKNRDRSGPTDTQLVRHVQNGIEKVTLVDDKTHWSEGMNDRGVSIISSSLTPIVKDDKEEHSSKNGFRIKHALAEKTVEDAVNSLVESEATGCIMVFDEDQLWLIEGEDETHKQRYQRITNDMVARTNHGIWIPSAGYQKGSDEPLLELRRISSEARLLIARHIVKIAQNPEDLMALLAHRWDSNPQLTTIRDPYNELKTRTTEQLLLEPYRDIMLLRSVDGKLDFDQDDANKDDSKVLVGIYDF